ncbi:MAG: Calx-beta domain-containing protein [Sphingomonas sp.]
MAFLTTLFGAFLSAGPVTAAETTAFTYDELGRLISSANSGGPRNGKASGTKYDPAGNRSALAFGQPLPTPTNAAVFSISAPASVNEGATAIFTISKSGTAASVLTVNVASANGTAAAPGDFAAVSTTLSFRSWETAKTVAIPIINDGVTEGAEQFSLALSGASAGSSIGTGTATTTINASGAANQPPVANFDALGNVGICTSKQLNVIANDTDPEGNYPLVLVSVGTSPLGDAYAATGTDLVFTAYGTTGSGNISYTVRDSFGATSTGVVTFTVVNGTGCN